MTSREHDDAVGEAPTAAEQLDVKRIELQQATAGLEAAELAYDIPKTVELQNRMAVLTKFIARLEAAAAFEAAAAAQVEAGELHANLRAQYAEALAALAPHLEASAKAIRAAMKAARACTTTWAAASRLWYEVHVLEMGFNLGVADIAILPIAPVGALIETFGEEVEQAARQSHRQPLPVYSSSASDSPEQVALNKMVAAHQAVSTLGADLKLSSELLALFAKAGAPAPRVPRVTAVIGTSPSVQAVYPGTLESALPGTNSPAIPETEKAKADRAEIRRRNTQGQAQVLREFGEEAARIDREDDLIRRGKLKGPLDQGLRG